MNCDFMYEFLQGVGVAFIILLSGGIYIAYKISTNKDN